MRWWHGDFWQNTQKKHEKTHAQPIYSKTFNHLQLFSQNIRLPSSVNAWDLAQPMEKPNFLLALELPGQCCWGGYHVWHKLNHFAFLLYFKQMSWCCEHVSESRHAAEDIPKFCSTILLDFYLLTAQGPSAWILPRNEYGCAEPSFMRVTSSYIGRYLLPGWVKFPTEAALFAVAAQSQAEAWWAWWAWLWRSKQPFLRNTSIVIHWLNLVDGRAITRNPTHQQMKMQWNMKAHPHIRHIIYK